MGTEEEYMIPVVVSSHLGQWFADSTDYGKSQFSSLPKGFKPGSLLLGILDKLWQWEE